MTKYIGVSETAYRLSVPYRKALDLLFSGQIRGVRRGNRWQAELASVQALEEPFPFEPVTGTMVPSVTAYSGVPAGAIRSVPS